MAIKLLHTADWQLGKPFSRFEGDVGAVLREARLDAVERIADARQARPTSKPCWWRATCSRASTPSRACCGAWCTAWRGFAGPWLLLPGNHDPARPGGVWDRFQSSGDCPDTIRILAKPEPVPLEGGRLVVLPAPLMQKHVSGDPTSWFDSADLPAGAVKVGLAHGSVPELLAGQAASPNAIPLNRAEQVGLDYLALGDWHSVLQVGPRTWYSGTPEPDDFTRSGLGEVLLVTLSEPGAPIAVDRRRTGRHIWQTSRVDLGVLPDQAVVADQLEAITAGIETPSRDRPQAHARRHARSCWTGSSGCCPGTPRSAAPPPRAPRRRPHDRRQALPISKPSPPSR